MPGLAAMAETGYYQLYFLLVIAQFYLVFPLLRRTRGHHGSVLAAAALAQVALAVLTHWRRLPPLMLKYAQQDGLSYLLYLVGGGIVACHLEAVDAWVRRHARLVVALTVAAALAAEGVYFLAHYGVTTVLGATSDPFQPSVIPFNIGAIACGYLAGVAPVRPGRSRFTRAVVRSGSDNAYGIYLSHMLVLTVLLWLGWRSVAAVMSASSSARTCVHTGSTSACQAARTSWVRKLSTSAGSPSSIRLRLLAAACGVSRSDISPRSAASGRACPSW